MKIVPLMARRVLKAMNFTGGAVQLLLASSQRDSGVRRTGLPFRHRFRGLPRNNILMLPETSQSRPSGSNSCETDHGIATYNAQLHVIYFARRSRSEAGAILFASHRQTRSPASRFIFRSAVVLVVAFACGLASQTAKAQLRFGIGVGGIGGGLAVFCWTTRQEGIKASKTNSIDNNTSETNKPWKVIPRKKPRKPEIRNRRKRKQKSQKSSSPRRSRPSLSLVRLRPHR